MKLHWLDWSEPLVPSAARWLVERYRRGDSVDLDSVICVTPGRRAGRLLLAELVERCETADELLRPPRMVTPGGAFDALLDVRGALASRHECVLAWMEVLAGADPAAIEPLLPAPPDPRDSVARRHLAELIHSVHELVGAALVEFADVPGRAEQIERFAEGERWRALRDLATRYHERLDAVGLVDPGRAERTALDDGRIAPAVQVVLVGVVELAPRQRALLHAFGDRATALVHAPEALASRFDDDGCPDGDAWEDAVIGLEDECIVVAEKPLDQAEAALGEIAQLGSRWAADEVTIGLADPALAEAIERVAAGAGLAVHKAAGIPLGRTPPARLLAAIAAWLGDRRFADLAALVRHPDLERWLARRMGGPCDWIGHLDQHHERHLRDRIDDDAWAAMRDDARLAVPLDLIGGLLRAFDGAPREIGAWCAAALDLLGVVYDGQEADARAACLELRECFAVVAAARPGLQPSVRGAEAIELLLAMVGEQAVRADVMPREIEMLGWLELHFDPAPVLVLVGANDGRWPEVILGDAFLPDALRRSLGLACNRRRYARDAYLTEAVRRSRRHLRIVSGRTGGDEEPLLPSRLLLAGDDESRLRRVRQWCGSDGDSGGDGAAAAPRRTVATPPVGDRSRFVVPRLPDGIEPPASMTVTEFRAYLACPYRYALEKRLRLRDTRDEARELDPMRFGTLAHAVLERFGTDPDLRVSDDADRIETRLLAALDELAAERFGRSPRPALRVQMARLGQRFRAFARVQAALRRRGWIIDRCEFTFDEPSHLEVPGDEPMPLRGKIDRIDRNEQTGHWRIIDYKAGDTARSPYATHNGSKTVPEEDDPPWKDLQLPLYEHLARQHGLVGEVELAYFCLPMNVEETGLRVGEWRPPQLESAIRTAQQVVRDVRAGRYELRAENAPWFDPYARICQTSVFVGDDADAEGVAS